MAIRNVPASAQLKLCAPACVVSKYCIAAIFTVVVIAVELNIGCISLAGQSGDRSMNHAIKSSPSSCGR